MHSDLQVTSRRQNIFTKVDIVVIEFE